MNAVRRVAMAVPRIFALTTLLAASLVLGACASYGGYGGASLGYGSGGYYPYYGGSYASGWYDDFYYPGYGIYVFDRGGARHRWNDHQRRYWEGHRYTVRGRENRRDFRDVRRGREDRRAFRAERRDDRRALGSGAVTREHFRVDRQADRQASRSERRADRRAFRQDLRGGRSSNSFEARRGSRNGARRHRPHR